MDQYILGLSKVKEKENLKLICFLINWWAISLERRLRDSSIPSICLLGMEDFISQLSTRERVSFQVKGSDVGQNLQLNIFIY